VPTRVAEDLKSQEWLSNILLLSVSTNSFTISPAHSSMVTQQTRHEACVTGQTDVQPRGMFPEHSVPEYDQVTQ
jgi:hypothetical protein